MTTLKFRAWDIKMKQMIFTGFHLMGEVMAFHLIEQHCFETKGEGQSLDRWNDILVMQYIGLKDKNDKDIYHGDIITIKHPHKDRSFTGKVEYFGYRFGCKDFYFSHFDIPNDIFSEGTEYIEVIGNIYENPELIP